MIESYLEDLENRMDPDVEEDLLSQWRVFLDGRVGSGLFTPQRRRVAPPTLDWPKIRVNEALDNPELMILQQLAGCSATLAAGSGAILNIRPNYGTGILPTIYGADVFRMDDDLDTLPTNWPIPGGAEAIARLLDRGVPDLDAGYGRACFATGKLMADLLRNYPKLSRYVFIYHPDLQGPMDVCELLWGSGIFLDLFDVPEQVHALLHSVTDTYRRLMHRWQSLLPPRAPFSAHWGLLFKGQLMIRDDSAMNLSPEMFDEFIRPYDQMLLSEFGGGAIHFCGRGDHFIDRLPQMDGVYAVNMSQPEYNDMERIFQNTVDRGIALIGFQRQAAEAALGRGRDLRGLVQVF